MGSADVCDICPLSTSAAGSASPLLFALLLKLTASKADIAKVRPLLRSPMADLLAVRIS